jgi:low affinity Fe/Cu permease
MTKTFAQFANWVAVASGNPIVFGIATLTLVVWLMTGPFYSHSDTWQLVMNTWTDCRYVPMVFLIQNSQNRDSSAIQAKIDELIRTSAARNSLVGIEKLTPEQIERVRQSCAFSELLRVALVAYKRIEQIGIQVHQLPLGDTTSQA